jgi:predicted Zn-dependent protease
LNVSGSRSLGLAAAATLALLIPVAMLTGSKTSPSDEVARPLPEKYAIHGRTKDPHEVLGTPAVAPPPPAPAVASVTITGPMAIGLAPTAHDLQAAKLRDLRALRDKPNDPELLNELGLVLLRLGQPDNAVPRFKRASEIAPTKWAYRFHLAYSLGALKQWDQAIAEYRAAARLSGDDYATQYNLGMALHAKGDDAAAIPEFRKAMERAPAEAGVHLSLGISLEKTGKIGDAQRQYSQFLQMAPDSPAASKLKAHIKTLS